MSLPSHKDHQGFLFHQLPTACVRLAFPAQWKTVQSYVAEPSARNDPSHPPTRRASCEIAVPAHNISAIPAPNILLDGTAYLFRIIWSAAQSMAAFVLKEVRGRVNATEPKGLIDPDYWVEQNFDQIEDRSILEFKPAQTLFLR